MIFVGVFLLVAFLAVFVGYVIFDCVRYWYKADRAQKFADEEKAKYTEKLKTYKHRKDDEHTSG